MTKQEKLYEFVSGFVKENEIACPESIYQSDKLQLGAPEFMEKCTEIVGYFDPDDPEKKGNQ